MSDDIKKSCFLIRVLNEDGETIDRGTGFFINEKGNFLSAGHVFKRAECTYLAEIDGQQYPVEQVLREYVDPDRYENEIYQDLFVGKLDYQPQAFMILANDTLADQTAVTISGYNRLMESENPSAESNYKELHSAIEKGGIVKINKELDKIFIMRNLTRIEPIPALASGLSGGPISSGNHCYGLLCTTASMLRMQYVIGQLALLKVSHSIKE